ncbi:MAG: hypothetical protein ACR2HM_00735 [Acidimicrobiales bacterium]
MPRIDIELTSSRPDGTWTWRAAGARQPRGVLDAEVLHAGAKVGDVVKAEADFDLDGINVTSVTPPKARKAPTEVLPLLGSGKEEALVTHSPIKPGRDGDERGRRGDRPFGGGGRGPGGRGERGPVGPDGKPLGPGATRPRATPAPASAPRDGARREGRGPGGPGQRERARPDRPERPRSERGDSGRPAREDGAGRDRPARERGGRDRPARPASAATSRPKPPAKRLQPARAHREAALGALAPEQRAIAEQLLRGGLPGVRAAVEEQNNAARAAGSPEIHADAILSLAEGLWPGLRAAEWRDKAEAAAAIVDEISLRDLRTVVAGADAAGRDEESRALASQLREGLERRGAAERQAWIDEIGTCLTEGRVVRALRVSGRAPEQGLRLPPELNTGLTTAAGEAMAADTAPDRWLAVLEAVVASPVRRSITPKALPSGADDETLKTVRAAISKVPALGPLLGESPTSRPLPPPPPRRPPPPPVQAPSAAPVAAPPVAEPLNAPATEPVAQSAAEPTDAPAVPEAPSALVPEAAPAAAPGAAPAPEPQVPPPADPSASVGGAEGQSVAPATMGIPDAPEAGAGPGTVNPPA